MMLMRDDLKASIEALLFASGDKVTLPTMSTLLNIDENELDHLIQEMVLDYASESRGIQLVKDDEGYYLCSKPHFADVLARAVKPVTRRLSNAAMETLAIVAYRQPVSKIDIERIRGVKSDHIITRLLEKELIEEVGYARLPGKPVLYATSFEFLKAFGISTLDDLPDIQVLNDQGEETNEEKAGGPDTID